MIVTLDEIKEHLRIQHDDEDEYLEKLLQQAENVVEDYCRITLDPYTDSDGNEIDPPEPIRLAIMIMTGFFYENRDIPDMTTYKAMRMAVDSLLYPYRDPDKMF